MTDLLQIEEPRRSAAPLPKWRAFLELGFRPLYLMACAWAIAGVALWVFAPQWLIGRMPGMVWHAHEMLWGFVVSVAVGFLLTATANWTGLNPLHGRPLAALCVVWLVARGAFLWPGDGVFRLGVACELLFFAGAAGAIGRVIYSRKSQRNYGVPLLLLGLGIADALYLRAAWQGDYALLMRHFNTGLLCMAVVTLLMARRVVPFFASRAVPGLDIPMHTRSGQWQLAAGLLAVLCALLMSFPVFSQLPLFQVQAIALAVAGLLALWQVIAWKPLAARHRPILWVLYTGYAGLGAGLLLAAAHAVDGSLRAAWPVHAIGVGGFSVLIIGMVTRTAMGHTGRALHADRSMAASYALVILAALLRLAALAPTSATTGLLHMSASAWVLAFGLYLWRFTPWLIRPRADQPRGIPVAMNRGKVPR